MNASEGHSKRIEKECQMLRSNLMNAEKAKEQLVEAIKLQEQSKVKEK